MEALKQQFQSYDKNGDGMLTVDELSAILLKGDPKMSHTEVKTLFNKVDRDENGLISFREFVDFIFEEEPHESPEATYHYIALQASRWMAPTSHIANAQHVQL
eukprot:1636344-Amphidinium_carterae.1